MTVLLAQISEHMSDFRSEYRVVTVHAGPDRDNLKFAGNLILTEAQAHEVVAVLDGRDEHEIHIRQFDYVVHHPLRCRLDPKNCTADDLQLTERSEKGRFKVRRVDGYWELGEKVA